MGGDDGAPRPVGLHVQAVANVGGATVAATAAVRHGRQCHDRPGRHRLTLNTRELGAVALGAVAQVI